MSIPNITRTNTVDEWRIQTNQSATALNSLETGTYTKSNGVLSITGNTTVSITANGTALQVSNSALFQSNVSIGGDEVLSGTLYVNGPTQALRVANNALVNTDLQVTRTIYTGNVTANGNISIGTNLTVTGNETVGGIVRLNGSGDVLYVNSGIAKIQTATVSELTSSNVNIDSSLTLDGALLTLDGIDNSNNTLYVANGRTTLQGVVVEGNLLVIGTFTQTGNSVYSIDTFKLNANTGLNRNGYFVNERTVGNNAIIQWNESTKYWQISQGNTYSQLNNIIDASFVLANVTSNSTTSVGSASAVKAAYDTATIAGGYANSAYSFANASFNFANTRFASAGGAISGDVSISGNLTVTGQTTYSNTTTVNLGDNIITLNADIPQASAPSENAGLEVDRGSSANVQMIWNETTDKWTFTNDGSSYSDIGSAAAESYANSAFSKANTATTNAATADQRAVTSGSYANSAYSQANTATTNAATADQRAVTSGSYANSAYSRANTAQTHANAGFDAANNKVASITAGTGVSVGGTTTVPIVSLPQAIGTGSDVQHNSFGVGTAATGTAGEIIATNNITAYYSDERLKNKLGNIQNALELVNKLSGFYYEANETAQALGYEVKKEVGVSAQEVQAIMPEVVAPAPIDNTYLTVRYERLVPLLIEAIKELSAEIDNLKNPK